MYKPHFLDRFPCTCPTIRFVPGRRRDGANVGERARKVRDAAGGVPQGAHRVGEEDEEGL